MKALGLIEVNGYLAAIEAADAALKAANVSLISIETVKAGICTVEITGDVGAVKASVEAGAASAEALGLLRTVSVIPRLHEETLKILLNTIGKAKSPYSKSDSNYLSLQTSVEDKTPSQVVNNSIEDDALNIIEKLNSQDDLSNKKMKALEGEASTDSNKMVLEKEIQEDVKNQINRTEQDYSLINVEELRRMVRKLKLPNIKNKEIKFAKKDLLIKILLDNEKEGDK